MEHIDLAIVGGSFAGVSCARSAAQNGLTTRVFERKISPGAYTQSTGLFVKEIAEILALPQHLTRKIAGVRLYAPNMQYIDLYSPDYYFIATDTQGVLSWMGDQAQAAGAELICSTQVQSVSTNGTWVDLPDQDTRARFLVAADGANSVIAQQLNLGRNRHCMMGAEYECEGFEELDNEKLHVFINSEFAPGYIAWLVKGVTSVQVGLAAAPGKRIKLKPFFEFLKSHFNSDANMISGRGGPIPCGGVVSPWARDNVCLLGDAAGMVSPLTAGGIHPSIEVGEQLGNAIAAHIRHQLPLPQEQIAAMIKRYPFKRQLRAAYNQIGTPNMLVNAMIGNPVFRRIAQLVFFHNRGLLCRDAWRDILFTTSPTP